MLLFSFVSLFEECLGVETILPLLVLIPKHSLSYQTFRIVYKKFGAKLPTAFSLK